MMYSKDVDNETESEISDTKIKADFEEGHSILLKLVDEILVQNEVPDIDNEIAIEFRNLLLNEDFISDIEMTHPSEEPPRDMAGISGPEKKIMDAIKNLIRKTSIPGPGDEIYNEMYKIMVGKFTKNFEEAQTNKLDAEVTARKLAAWIMKFNTLLKQHEKEKNERKASEGSSLNSDMLSYKLPEEEENENSDVKVYNFSTQQTQPYWEKPGPVVELKDKEGSKIYVKGLVQGDRKKTLVKKVKNTDKGKEEVSSWVVEIADREQVKTIKETIPTNSPSKTFRTPSTIDEWKTIADIRSEEAKAWKKKLGIENPQEKRTEHSHPERKSVTGDRARSSNASSSAKSQYDRDTNEVGDKNKNRYLSRISGQKKHFRNSMVTNSMKTSTTYYKENKQELKLRKKNLCLQSQVLDSSTQSL